jgi:hypothetical protein
MATLDFPIDNILQKQGKEMTFNNVHFQGHGHRYSGQTYELR